MPLDRSRLEQALVAADAAGDTEAAQQLASALRGMQSEPKQEAPAVSAPSLGDYRDKYSGQGLIQGNLNYLKDYISGIGSAAIKDRPLDGQDPLAGGGEVALHLGSSALAPLFALPDWAITKLGIPDPRNPSGTYAGAREKYVYQPRGSIGKTGADLAGAALKPVGDVFSLIGSGYGDMAGLAGASPAVQKEVRDIAPDVVSAGLMAKSLRAPKEAQAPIPTTAELRDAKNAAYKAGTDSGVLTTPEQNTAAVTRINEALKSENLVVDPDLHPKSTALLRRLNDQQGKPLTVPEAESLRQLALEVQRDADPVTRQPTADAYRAGVILDELDNSLDALSVNKPARAANARFRRSQMIDEMIHRAEIKAGANYTQAGMEHALRQEFKQLALNPKRMRGLTMEQKAAIEKVAKGGALENSLRALGKFDPTTGGMAAFIGTGTGTMAGTALGGMAAGGLGAIAVPALGFLGKRGATAMTARNVAAAREALIGRAPAEAPVVAQSAEAPGAMVGELMQRPPLVLPAPNVIAGNRSAPGTAYAREQMGITPDVEQAGALHPGAARESVPPFASTPALPYRPIVAESQPMTVDTQGRVATDPGQLAAHLREVLAAQRAMKHPSAPRPAKPPLALPFLKAKDNPMIVDEAGRVAQSSEALRSYLQESGLLGMRNVRQPRAEPTPGLLGTVPELQAPPLGRSTRSADAVRLDLQKLDKKLRSLPAREPLDSPRMKALAAEWERLRAELSLAESQDAAP